MNCLHLPAIVTYLVLLSATEAQFRNQELDTGVITGVAPPTNYNSYNQAAQVGWVPPNTAYPYNVVTPPTYSNINGNNNPGSLTAMVDPASSYHVPRARSSASRLSSHLFAFSISILSAGFYFLL